MYIRKDMTHKNGYKKALQPGRVVAIDTNRARGVYNTTQKSNIIGKDNKKPKDQNNNKNREQKKYFKFFNLKVL